MERRIKDEILRTYFPVRKSVNMDNLRMTKDAYFSITKPRASYIINKIIESIFGDLGKMTITDATANVGGNAIRFGFNFGKVNAVEICNTTYEILRNNIKVYNLGNVTVFNNDYLVVYDLLEQDLVFIDPPWGGYNYINSTKVNLFLSGVAIDKVINLLKDRVRGVIIKVPNNFDFERFEYLQTAFDTMRVYEVTNFKLIVLSNEYYLF
jgi:predicted RNA methylase